MIVHMCKFRIVALDEQFDRLIEALQRLRYLHLEPVPLELPRHPGVLHRLQLTAEDGLRRQTLADARRDLDELRAIVGTLPEPPETDPDAGPSRQPDELRTAAAELLRKARALRRRRRHLEQDLRILRACSRVVQDLPVAKRDDAETAVLMFTFPSEERVVGRALRKGLRHLPADRPRVQLFRVSGGRTVAAVLCRPAMLPQIRDTAWRAGALECRLPAMHRSDRRLDAFRRIAADLETMPRQHRDLERELAALRCAAARWAAALECVCAEESQRLEARHNFIAGSLLRVLHAYAPLDKRDEVTRAAWEATEGRFEIEELALGPRLEEVPVVLKNPTFAKPFEVLLRLFPPPTYGTLDPTIVNAVGVPVFFGLIVGDVAYGVILLCLALLLRWRGRHREMRRAVGTVGIYCAGSTMLFGLLYGEAFGSFGLWLGLRPLINREDPEQLLLLLKIAVCIGALHVGLGLVLGMINARQVLDRHVFHERLGQLLCLLSAVLLLLGLFVSRLCFAAALGSLAVGVGVLLCGAGVVGLLEVFSLFSNILSYSRLMALGVASSVLALVANRVFAELNHGLIGLLAAGMLHALNVLIAMFSPTIHTLRLHYVEFFTKFYRPEGRDYVPFGSGPGAAP